MKSLQIALHAERALKRTTEAEFPESCRSILYYVAFQPLLGFSAYLEFLGRKKYRQVVSLYLLLTKSNICL